MHEHSRRRFLGHLGHGMLAASLGPSLVAELGLAPVSLGSGDPLHFGDLEPLVALVQETSLDKLQPLLVEKLSTGLDLGTLVAAAALANARTFGGTDYIGIHCEMALMPAYAMAKRMPGKLGPLPVLKVIYRSTARIHAVGGRANEAMARIEPREESADGAQLRALMRRRDMGLAEAAFAAQGDPKTALNDLLWLVQDGTDVHRTVLAWRAWDMLPLVGEQNTNTMLRQSLRYCVDDEQARHRRGTSTSGIRDVLPKLLDEHRLLDAKSATRAADDAWVEEMSRTIFAASQEHAAAAVAAALAEGFSPEDVGEAMSLAANRLLLHDPGHANAPTAAKPRGSVHGASVGVHASDAANAWRQLARVGDRRNQIACLIAGGYHTGGQSQYVRAEPFASGRPAAREMREPGALLDATASCIRAADQAGACAFVERYGKLGLPPRPMFDVLLEYGVEADGALHAEKYYNTVEEEFAVGRPRFRWRHVVGLARVTASEQTDPAPGLAQARELLG